MRNTIVFAIAGMLALSILPACATIINGGHQEIAISTSPNNASIYIDGFFEGETPIVLDVERKGKHILTIELDGFETEELILDREVSGWVIGNIVWGGPIGLAVDAITGSMWRIDPDAIELDLIREDSKASLEEGTLHLAVVMHSKPGWEKIGQLKPAR